jgi:hypothetical protein
LSESPSLYVIKSLASISLASNAFLVLSINAALSGLSFPLPESLAANLPKISSTFSFLSSFLVTFLAVDFLDFNSARSSSREY